MYYESVPKEWWIHCKFYSHSVRINRTIQKSLLSITLNKDCNTYQQSNPNDYLFYYCVWSLNNNFVINGGKWLFFYIQSGETPTSSCIILKFKKGTQHFHSQLQCELYCNTLSQCVGMDIIGHDQKTCRLLNGFAAFITMHTAP